MQSYFKNSFSSDFLSSVVVFLVALPLSMGIAIASGVDPVIGLLSGMIGGIVVGAFSGCPLQVSGPAAGLAVMVFQFIEKFGMGALVPLGIIIGIFQVTVYKFKLAGYFRAISPALIRGMLAGIGLLILISQIHVALGEKPGGNGFLNIVTLPERFANNFLLSAAGRLSFIVALATVLMIFLWQKYLPRVNKKVPAPLFAILVVSPLCFLFAPSLEFVSIPQDLFSSISLPEFSVFSDIGFSLVFSALAIGFVASVESLLSVNAVDKLAGTDSDYNKEIMAQGIGNFLAGLIGAIPITGVIVRSSANLESGGETRGSAIMHGVWLFGLVFFFPQVLGFVPISALAGILIFTGLKLLDAKGIPAIFKNNWKEGVIFSVTLLLIVTVDLLTGVIAGFGTSLLVLIFDTVKLDVEKKECDEKVHVQLTGKATFLHVPKITEMLSNINDEKEVTIDMTRIQYVDDAIKEEVFTWEGKMKLKSRTTKVYLPEGVRSKRVV